MQTEFKFVALDGGLTSDPMLPIEGDILSESQLAKMTPGQRWKIKNPNYYKDHYQKNKDKISKRHKEWRDANPDYFKRHYESNKEKKIKSVALYYQKNKKALIKRKSERVEERTKACPIYRMIRNQRRYLNQNLVNQKKSDRTLMLIGTTREGLRSHIESLFQKGMSWNNYGKDGWVIDHIRPCVSFDLSDPSQQKECFGFKNLQPMWDSENCKKSSIYNGKLVRMRKK